MTTIAESTDRAGRILDVYAQRINLAGDTETHAASLITDLMHYVQEFTGMTAAELLEQARATFDADRDEQVGAYAVYDVPTADD